MSETKSSRSKRSSGAKLCFSILDNSTLRSLIEKTSLIEPFEPELISCSGVDLRLADEYCSLKKANRVYDTRVRNPPNLYYSKERNAKILVNPNTKFLVCTIERLRVPRDLMGFVGLRSSYSRLGLQTPLGFIDPGFVGQLTMEINGGTFPILLHSGDRVFHVVFATMKETTKSAYSGRYQNQKGVVLPIFPE